MEHRNLSILVIKIVGMLNIVAAIEGMPNNIKTFLEIGEFTVGPLIGWLVVPLVVPLGFGLLMWFLPITILNIVVNISNRAIDDRKDDIELECFMVALVGVVLVFFSISNIVHNLVNFSVLQADNKSILTSIIFEAPEWGAMASTILELVFGLSVLLNVRRISLLVK